MRHIALLATTVLVAWTASFVVAPAGDIMMRFYCWSLVMVAIVAAYVAGRKIEHEAAATTPKSSRTRWQFSIREMILGILVVSLAMVIGTRSRPFTTTPIFDALHHHPLPALQRKIDVARIPNGHGFDSVEESQATWMDEEDIDTSDTTEFGRQSVRAVAALHTEMIRRLRRVGCGISRDWNSPDEFDVQYKLGLTVGQIRAYSFPISASNWKLRMFVNETRTD